MKSPVVRVVVDGSNLATEGRTIPSLVQLDDAVRAFLDEYEHADVIVVVDASFEHRVASSERTRFKEAEIAGEIVTPPAGAVGRGDAFILKIAQRIDAVVLSNDSFQEFHEQYPWLFETGRLIGGKPVKGVGWVFTERLPVRGVKSVRATRAVKKLAVELPEGVVPTIGDTLTPVKAPRSSKRAVLKAHAVTTPMTATPEQDAPAPAKVARAAKKSATPSTKEPKAPRAARATKSATSLKGEKDLKVAKVARVAKSTLAADNEVQSPLSDAEVKPARSTKKPVAKKAPAQKEVPVQVDVAPTPPVVALRRGRQPVNPSEGFSTFVKSFKTGALVTGEVVAFTSHGAVIKVTLKNGVSIECYAPTTSLGSPAPARARDVLKRGDQRSFRLVLVDSERRMAELALT